MLMIPTGDFTVSFNALITLVFLDRIEGDTPEDRQVFSTISGFSLAAIFRERDIQYPVQIVLNSPVLAADFKYLRS